MKLLDGARVDVNFVQVALLILVGGWSKDNWFFGGHLSG